MSYLLPIILILILYVLPAIRYYSWVKKIHGENGRWSFSKPDTGDIFFTLIPLGNLIACIVILDEYPYTDEYRQRKNKFLNKNKRTFSDMFFRVKKKLI